LSHITKLHRYCFKYFVLVQVRITDQALSLTIEIRLSLTWPCREGDDDWQRALALPLFVLFWVFAYDRLLDEEED